MNAGLFEVVFPVESQEMSLRALRAEAVQRVTQSAHERGLNVTGSPSFKIMHGANATLTVTLPVAGHMQEGNVIVE